LSLIQHISSDEEIAANDITGASPRLTVDILAVSPRSTNDGGESNDLNGLRFSTALQLIHSGSISFPLDESILTCL
jgi:hypothetical protein